MFDHPHVDPKYLVTADVTMPAPIIAEAIYRALTLAYKLPDEYDHDSARSIAVNTAAKAAAKGMLVTQIVIDPYGDYLSPDGSPVMYLYGYKGKVEYRYRDFLPHHWAAFSTVPRR
jgi:hypothetical protein